MWLWTPVSKRWTWGLVVLLALVLAFLFAIMAVFVVPSIAEGWRKTTSMGRDALIVALLVMNLLASFRRRA